MFRTRVLAGRPRISTSLMLLLQQRLVFHFTVLYHFVSLENESFN